MTRRINKANHLDPLTLKIGELSVNPAAQFSYSSAHTIQVNDGNNAGISVLQRFLVFTYSQQSHRLYTKYDVRIK